MLGLKDGMGMARENQKKLRQTDLMKRRKAGPILIQHGYGGSWPYHDKVYAHTHTHTHSHTSKRNKSPNLIMQPVQHLELPSMSPQRQRYSCYSYYYCFDNNYHSYPYNPTPQGSVRALQGSRTAPSIYSYSLYSHSTLHWDRLGTV